MELVGLNGAAQHALKVGESRHPPPGDELDLVDVVEPAEATTSRIMTLETT